VLVGPVLEPSIEALGWECWPLLAAGGALPADRHLLSRRAGLGHAGRKRSAAVLCRRREWRAAPGGVEPLLVAELDGGAEAPERGRTLVLPVTSPTLSIRPARQAAPRGRACRTGTGQPGRRAARGAAARRHRSPSCSSRLSASTRRCMGDLERALERRQPWSSLGATSGWIPAAFARMVALRGCDLRAPAPVRPGRARAGRPPGLTKLVVGGEALCAVHWPSGWAPGRRLLNAYGRRRSRCTPRCTG
jgi:hypothetical protein